MYVNNYISFSIFHQKIYFNSLISQRKARGLCCLICIIRFQTKLIILFPLRLNFQVFHKIIIIFNQLPIFLFYDILLKNSLGQKQFYVKLSILIYFIAKYYKIHKSFYSLIFLRVHLRFF